MEQIKQQTAVEWLEQAYLKWSHEGNFIPTHLTEQAKQMEEEQQKVTENTSDGYHTFKELYEFRKLYNAALFNEWAKQKKFSVHKSWRHADGELCFGGGWFIVVAITMDGQISNHYEAKDWDLFKIPAHDKALFEFDGHTSSDVIERLKNTL
jgi:hypothetical protein